MQSKLVRFLSILAFILLCSSPVYGIAEPVPDGIMTEPLVTITNDRNASVSTVYAMLNDAGVFRGIYIKTTHSGSGGARRTKGHVYWLQAIENGNGVVLGDGQGVDAIFLSGNVNSQKGSGTLVIRYLSNGIFWSYDECMLGLQRTDLYDWRLVNNQQPISHIKVQTWALGISTLTNVCPTTV